MSLLFQLPRIACSLAPVFFALMHLLLLDFGVLVSVICYKLAMRMLPQADYKAVVTVESVWMEGDGC